MKKFQIKQLKTETTLFEGKFENFSECLEQAIEEQIDLSGADLTRQNLSTTISTMPAFLVQIYLFPTLITPIYPKVISRMPISLARIWSPRAWRKAIIPSAIFWGVASAQIFWSALSLIIACLALSRLSNCPLARRKVCNLATFILRMNYSFPIQNRPLCCLVSHPNLLSYRNAQFI